MGLIKNKRLLIGTLILAVIIAIITIRLTTAEDGVSTSDKNTLEIPNIEMGGEVYDPNISINKASIFKKKKI